MMLSLSGVCYLVSVILFALSALPPTASWPLMQVGLAFLALGHLVP